MSSRKSESVELEYPFFESDGSSSNELGDYGMSSDDYEGPPIYDLYDDQFDDDYEGPPIFDDDQFEDDLEKLERFVGKGGFGEDEDNTEKVVVLVNDLCSLLIQTTDIVLPRVFDDATVASLNSIIHSKNGMVVSMLKDDNTFMKELFTRLKSPFVSKSNLGYFLRELCNLRKSLQMIRDIVNEGISGVIGDIMRSDNKKLTVTVLMFFMSKDPYVCCAPLIGLLVKSMLKDFGDDVHCQFLEIIQSLLDTYDPTVQREVIIDILYGRHVIKLFDIVTSSCPPYGRAQIVHISTSSNGFHGNQTSAKQGKLLNISDLLRFYVMQHRVKIKLKFLLSDEINNVLSLTCRKKKYLVVAAIRLIRSLTSIKDEQLMNHNARNNLFKPILDIFVGKGSRYSLSNSAVLKLFECTHKENMKILLKYIVETFWDQLVRFDSLPSIQSLKVRYDQAMEQATNQTGPHESNDRRRVNERVFMKEEEDYFNEERDEEGSIFASIPRRSVRAQPGLPNGASANSSSLSPRSGRLVDYEGDKDDEDYKPPPRDKLGKSEEDEFKNWNIDFSFHNLNNNQCSGQDHKVALQVSKTSGSGKTPLLARLLRLCFWKKEPSVLGITYTLFKNLAGEEGNRKSVNNHEDENIKKILLQLTSLVVLDEGHTPRNDQSLMWKALLNLKTERSIILSGTPFQNNFDELFSTLCLVNPSLSFGISSIQKDEFSKKRGWKNNSTKDQWDFITSSVRKSPQKLTELKAMVERFVDVHKGTITREKLPGLKDALVVLKPTKTLRSLLERLSGTKSSIRNEHLMSLVYVYPSLLPENPSYSDRFYNELKMFEKDALAGIKCEARGGKVLVFSWYIKQLELIKQLLNIGFGWVEGIECLYMDGQQDEKVRPNSMNKFNDPKSEAKVLLASFKAYFKEINLVAASRVVLLDVHWNLSVEQQPTSTVYRLGHNKVVYEYHLVTGSMERKLDARDTKLDATSTRNDRGKLEDEFFSGGRE